MTKPAPAASFSARTQPHALKGAVAGTGLVARIANASRSGMDPDYPIRGRTANTGAKCER